MRKTAYDDRTDLQKLQSQWNKIGGIFSREKEWSAAIVRAATAAEIAANVAIRKRFEADSDFSEDFVDSLLIWANGIDGKFKRLIIPAENDKQRLKDLNALQKLAEKINKKRNAIVHRGAFSEEKEARDMVAVARQVIEGLVKPYEPAFELKSKKPSRGKDKG